MSKLSDLLNDPVGEKRYAAVAFGYQPALARVAAFPISTDGLVAAPSDPSFPNTHFAPRLRGNGLPTFERSLFSNGKLSGRSTGAQTQIVVASADGEIDNFYAFAWAGRPLDFFIGGPGFEFAEYGYVMRLVMGEPSFEDDIVSFPLRDIADSFDVEIQTRRYAGTGGAEGQGEVRDKLKPDAWGYCPHVQPPYLGLDAKGRHTFGLGSGPIVGLGTYPIPGDAAPPEVFDSGSPLFYAGDPTNPQPGEYVVDVETATLTLGGAFQGTIQVNILGRRYISIPSASTHTISGGTKTFVVPTGAAEQQFSVGMRVRCLSVADPAGTWLNGTVTTPKPGGSLAIVIDSGASTGATSVSSWIICPWGTAAGILCGMAESVLGSTVIDSPFRVALNELQPAVAGYWVSEGGNALQLLDAVAEGSGCYWMTTRLNTFRVGRFDLPLGDPVAYLSEADILSVSRVSTDPPASQVTIKFGRQWSTLPPDQVAGVVANKLAFTEPWSSLTGVLGTPGPPPLSVKDIYPGAKPYEVETIFHDANVAATELSRQANLFGARRDYYRVRIKGGLLAFALTNLVWVRWPRHGLASGRLLRIADLKEDYETGIVELGVWA